MAVSEQAARDLVYRSCMVLDAEDFPSYVALCGADFRYRITTYSPELKQDMVWLEHDRPGVASLLEMVPEHVRLPGKFLRHATVYATGPGDAAGRWSVVSTVTVYYTDPDGATGVFAVGRYHDLIGEEAGEPRLLARHVRLETRDLGAGSHIPM